MANTTEIITANQTWVAPNGCANLTVELYGGGGGGGKVTSTTGVRGGGGGGEYAKETSVAVTPGTGYAIAIGAAGSTAGGNGGDTTFATTTVVAHGGTGAGASSTGANGGTGSTNATHYNGGRGVDGAGSTAGGGGGSGGTASNGNTGSGATGATAVTGGYNGGNGRSGTTGVGSAPSDAYGGGGGGAYRSSSGTSNGGAGKPGLCKLTYDYTPNALTFTGTEYGLIDNFAAINALDDFTIEMWIYRNNASAAYNIYASIDATALVAEFQRDASGTEGIYGEMNYNTTRSYTYKSSGAPANLTWGHVAMTHTVADNKCRLFVNGVELASYNTQQAGGTVVESSNGGTFMIADSVKETTSPSWVGRIGGFVRLWNRALDATTLNANKALTLQSANETGLIVNLNFTEQSGTVVDNEATAGADLNLTGTPAWVAGPVTTAQSYAGSAIKTVNGLAKASIKTINGLAIASVKTINGLA